MNTATARSPKCFLVVGPCAWGKDSDLDAAIDTMRRNIPRYIAGPHKAVVVEFNCWPSELRVNAGVDVAWECPTGAEVGRKDIRVKARR